MWHPTASWPAASCTSGSTSSSASPQLLEVIQALVHSGASPKQCAAVTSAFVRSSTTPTGPSVDCESAVPRLEEVLVIAGGGNKVSIAEAKQRLRRAGRADLASRLSRLSKGRNVVAHPDVGLCHEVRRALEAPGVCADDEPSVAGLDLVDLAADREIV